MADRPGTGGGAAPAPERSGGAGAVTVVGGGLAVIAVDRDSLGRRATTDFRVWLARVGSHP